MKNSKLHILVPTDFSDNAWSALMYALKLYANETCTFYLLHSTHILDMAQRTYITTHYVDSQKRLAEGRLTQLKVKAQMGKANNNHDFEILISDKELKTAVEKAVKEYQIDSVVMGTKGATDALEYVMGSNTIKVIQKTKDCPILIVPDKFGFVKPTQIAFPTDYNRFYDDKELKPLKDMADLFNSKITVVHIQVEKKLTEVQERNLFMLLDYFSNDEHSLHWLPDTTHKSKAIATFIEEHEIDMLAMVNYKHGFFESILNEPVIKNLAYHLSVPILVIPE